MSKEVEVYRPGTEVVLDGDVNARVMAVTILSEDMVQYKCAWWNSDVRTSEWVRPEEIVSVDTKDKNIKIGFKHE